MTVSLYIDVDRVTNVMIGANWYEVAKGTFDLDSYEYHHQDNVLHGGGQSGVCATGFAFETRDGACMAGPLTAIQAVRYSKGKLS